MANKLANVFPNFTLYNCASGRGGNIKHLPHIPIGVLLGGVETSNLQNLINSEYAASVSLANVGNAVKLSVMHVFARSSPPKIFKPVIRFYSVAMAALHTIRGWTNERQQNQAVGKKLRLGLVFTESDHPITMISNPPLNDSPVLILHAGAHASKIRNVIRRITWKLFPNL